ncbi:MAG TPA: ABC transporter permease [Gemmatimonadales bacterium]
MSAFDALRHRLRALLQRRAWERELEEELRFHRELEEMHQAHAGLSPEAARLAARRRLGSEVYYGEETRRAAGWETFYSVIQDVRFVLRSLWRDRQMAGFVVLTLALGIGANAAMFGVVDRLLLRGPEHIREPERVVGLYLTDRPTGRREFTTGSFGYVSYDVLRAGTRSFQGLAVYNANDVTTGRGAEARELRASYVTASYFPLLGTAPALGRFLSPEDDAVGGAQPVAVLGHGLWQSAFGGDPGVLGRTMAIADEPYTIIGVAPKGFTGPGLTRVDVWLPMSVLGPRVTDNWTRAWDAQWLRVIGRLKPGVTAEQAGVDATAAYQRAYQSADGSFTPRARLSLAPLGANEQGREPTETTVSRWLVGVTAIVLLIACANVINLLLARAVRRRREVMVRIALGVGRWRLVRLLLTESVLLALAGSAAGIIVASLISLLVRQTLLTNIEWTRSPVDSRVLLLSAGLAVVTGVLVGIVPALQATRLDVATGLKAGVREGGGQRSRLRAALTVAQAALSVVLLVGAGLFVKSLRNAGSLDLGIQPDRALTVSVRWPSLGRFASDAARERERAQRMDFWWRAVDRMRALPGVEHASLAVGTPFRSSFTVNLRIPGRDSVPRLMGRSPSISAVTSAYFATVGTPLLRGRDFTPADGAGSERVAIVSDVMAQTVWPGQEPIGACLIVESLPCARIVGVVADARRFRLREDPHMHYYVPLGQEAGMGGTVLLVRPTGDPEAFSSTVRRELLAMDPEMGYIEVATMQQDIDPQVRPWRLGAAVFGLAGVLALVVAAVGLYSVLSYLVEQRAVEIGVRVALGAGAATIIRLILTHSARAALLGVALGIGLALAGGRFLEPLLFEASSGDIGVMAFVATSLLAVAVVASVLPAWRAQRVDPMEALRAE